MASDPDLAQQLCQAVDGLQLDAAAHEREHAIEVELPWLARWAPDAHVVGIAIGQANLEPVPSLCRPVLLRCSGAERRIHC